MDQLKSMKEQLTSLVQGQLVDVKNVDAEELGEVVDMIKDLSETIYYCTITEAMEESKEKEKYQQPMMQQPYRNYEERYPYYRDMDRMDGRMYYSGGGPNTSTSSSGYNAGSMSSNGGSRQYHEGWEMYPIEMQDYREGISHKSRKNYIESKEMHQDKATQMQELEKYMQELSQDITDMIYDAEPDEKQLLRNKLTTLVEKIR